MKWGAADEGWVEGGGMGATPLVVELLWLLLSLLLLLLLLLLLSLLWHCGCGCCILSVEIVSFYGAVNLTEMRIKNQVVLGYSLLPLQQNRVSPYCGITRRREYRRPGAKRSLCL